MIRFFVPGVPRSTQTGSVVRAGGRSFPLKRNPAWITACQLVARAHAPAQPMTGPLWVVLMFMLPRPRRSSAYPTVRPDIDGMCKGLLDAWNGVLWVDDRQVVKLDLRKVYAERRCSGPGVRVEVIPL